MDKWFNFYNSLPTVRSSTTNKGTLLIKPYSNSEQEIIARAKKIVGQYKVLTYKSWSGNGFGDDTLLFIYDTNTQEVKLINNYSYTELVHIIERLLSQ